MVLCMHWRKLCGLSGEGDWALSVFTACEMYVPRKMPELCCRRAVCVRERDYLCGGQQPWLAGASLYKDVRASRNYPRGLFLFQKSSMIFKCHHL